MEGFKWRREPHGEWMRVPYWCADADCGSVEGDMTARQSGTVVLFDCARCGKQSRIEGDEHVARRAAIVAEQRAERWVAEDAGYDASLGGRTVRVGSHPEWIGRVMFYHRNAGSGYGLNGCVRVLVVDPMGSGLAEGAQVDVGAVTLRLRSEVASA